MNDVERVRIYEKDSAPDGFPAVEMALLTRLADRVVELEEWQKRFRSITVTQAVKNLKDGMESHDVCEDMITRWELKYGELCKERDALQAQLDNAIKDAASWKKCFETSIDDHARTSGKLARAFALLDKYFEPISRKEQVKLDDEDSEKLRAEVARLTDEFETLEKTQDSRMDEVIKSVLKRADEEKRVAVEKVKRIFEAELEAFQKEAEIAKEHAENVGIQFGYTSCEKGLSMEATIEKSAAIREGKG